ncbi:hypothetical protein GCM10009856_38330 [Mycolicibacterium llatzerense]
MPAEPFRLRRRLGTSHFRARTRPLEHFLSRRCGPRPPKILHSPPTTRFKLGQAISARIEDTVQTPLTNILQGLLREPEPVLRPTITGLSPHPEDKDRITRATLGFVAAARAVNESDHAATLRDWNERQAAFTSWARQLNRAEQADAPVLVRHALADEHVFAEMRILTLWQARRSDESARKAQMIAQCWAAVQDIVATSAARLQAADASAQVQLAAVARGIEAARVQVRASNQANLRSIRESAVERINALTRQVLDLDEYTAPVTIQQWWTRCGIDYRW